MIDLVYPLQPAPIIRNLKADSSAEMLPIVDSHGVVKSQATRSYCHSQEKLLHPVVHLHIINREGQIFLQQRGADKDLLPLKWDTAVGGHVSYGEYINEALYREAYEELGLRDFFPYWLTAYEHETTSERELVNVFAIVGSYKLKLNSEEVADGRFWTEEEIEKNIGQSVFTPNFEAEFVRIKKSLYALL